ncbi:MAG: tyrosine-type recombinase/integrase, partial [Elusimicrobiota bacterium]
GPRFEELLKSLTPHPKSGLYFANPETGKPYCPRYLQKVFQKAVIAAGIEKRLPLRSYDLRGTFAMHRAMIVRDFRQLQTEMGHRDAGSLQNYLAEAGQYDPRESIFYGVDVSV